MSQHNVEINVTANTAGATKSLGYLQSLMGEFGKQGANRIAAIAGAAAVAKMAFDKLSEAISSNIAAAKQASQMAIKFNIDPSAMYSITMASKDAGISVRSLTMAMKTLGDTAGKAIVNKEMRANFEQLGISAEKLSQIQAKPIEFLPEIAKGLMKIGDENQRAAAGALMLGRGYKQVLPIIESLGTSQAAREKFTNNANAQTEEEIAQHKQIAQLQNDMSDQWQAMVAAVAPLLQWAMAFVSLLGDGVGFIKDMIFETKQAKSERIATSNFNVVDRISKYNATLEDREKAGTLSDAEKEGIEKAGGRKNYVTAQIDALQKAEKFREREKAIGYSEKEMFEGDTGSTPLHPEKLRLSPEKQLERFNYATSAGNEMDNVSPELQKFLGLSPEGLGQERNFLGMTVQGQADKAYQKAQKDLETAGETGAFSVIKDDIGNARKLLREKKDKEAASNLSAQVSNAKGTLSKAAILIGRVFDEKTGEIVNKSEYKLRQEDRGPEEAEKQDGTFIDEKKAEAERKAILRSERKLAASERKLYVGSKSEGKMRMGLDDEESAMDTLEDSKLALLETQDDYNDQLAVTRTIEVSIAQLEQDKVKNATLLNELKAGLVAEKIKERDLEVKTNEALIAQNKAVENLSKAKEKMYFEEYKRQEKAKQRTEADADFELQMKYKVMQVDKKSSAEISKTKYEDEVSKYSQMAREYKAAYEKFQTNEGKGLKGEALSETEIKELESLTSKLDAQKRSVLESAFNAGNQGDTGKVTDMRRIGGGGMEYGGLANTAKQHLDVGRSTLKEIQTTNRLLDNASGVQRDSLLQGKTYNDVMPRVGADGSPGSR